VTLEKTWWTGKAGVGQIVVDQEKMWLARRGCGGPVYDEVGTPRFRGPEKAVVSEQLERLWLTRIDLVG
jgi:hypothetical protein